MATDTSKVNEVLGKNATVGAGTTVTKDVAAEELCISRVAQKSISGWQRPVKNTNKSKKNEE